MTQTIVHLARHGEVHNPTGVLYGRLPGFTLSDRGRQMAAALADWASAQEIVTLVSSPLQRAQETMAPIAQRLGLTVDIDERLIEAENVFEGLKFGVGDGSLRKPSAWRHLWNPFRPSWGEPYVEQVERMKLAIEAARDAARGKAALCVSHQLPIWIVRSAFEDRPLIHDPRRRICSVASVTSFVFDDDQFVELRYSEPAGHLLPPGAKRFTAGA
jgi:broad specificity phosphatase PhoE